MLIATFASDTAYGQFCQELLRAILAAAQPDFLIVEADTLQEMAESVAGRKIPGILLQSHRPSGELLQISARLHPLVLLFDEDAEDLAGGFLRQKNSTWPVSLQQTCAFMCSTAPARELRGAKCIPRGENTTLREFLVGLLPMLNIPVDPAHLAEAGKQLQLSLPGDLDCTLDEILSRRSPDARPVGTGVPELTLDAIEMMRGIYRPLASIIDGDFSKSIVWPIQIFFSQTEKKALSGVLPAPLSMLGPSRFLYFGPYLCLPEGAWKVEIEFQVWENLSKNRIEIDVFKDSKPLAFDVVDLPESGAFTASTEFFNPHGEIPLEIRMFLKEGAIEGQFEMKRVVLTPDKRI